MKKSTEILLVLSLILCSTLFIYSAKAQCHIDDWIALQAFVKSTKGTVLDDWSNVPYSLLDTTLNTPPINCDLSLYPFSFELNNQGRIKRLEITGRNVIGYIPSEVGKLTDLSFLVISSYPNYGITGTIPPELGNLTNLKILALDGNTLGGCFNENLLNLCDGQFDAFFISNNNPDSNNNNFETSWENFCTSGKGKCKEFSVVDAQADIETEEGDVYVKDSLHGVILKSENGLCFRISVKNDGTLLTNKVRCPKSQ